MGVMRAAVVHTLDGPSAMSIVSRPDPQPGPDVVLVEVHAAAVTFPDVLLSRGEYQVKPQLPFVGGQTAAGVVVSAPPGSGVAPGDRVAVMGSGCFAELMVTDPRVALPIPDQLSFAEAALVPMNYLTSHFALTERGRLKSGETVLVHGAGGGLGSVAVQFARALGARVIAVVSSARKGELAAASGAHDVVAVDDFLGSVRDLTGGRGVDVVFDPVGGDRVTDSLRSLSTGGRLLVLGFTAGEIPNVRVNRLLLNNTEVVGVGWGGYIRVRPDYAREQWEEVRPMLESGQLKPIVGAAFPFERIADAVASLADRTAVGNVVVTIR